MRELSEFLIELYRSAREVPIDGFQEAALNRLSALVPFDSARWGTASADERGAKFHAPYLYRDSPESLLEYNEFRDHDIAALTVMANPIRSYNFPLCQLLGKSGAGISEYVHRHRHEQALITAQELFPGAGVYHSLSMYGAYQEKPFSEDQRRLTELLFPHLREAQRINQAMHLEKVRPRLGTGSWALALCDSAGHWCFAETAFLELVRREWADRVHRVLPDELRLALSSAKRVPGWQGRYVVFGFERVCGWVLLRARIRLPIDALSFRELEVATRVAAGLTHKEIAKVLHVSPATVRNHLQAIHERVGVRNNAELAAQIKDAGL